MIKIFSKVHCKAYMKKICDNVHIQFYNADGTFCYDKVVTDYKAKAIAYGFDEDKWEQTELADLSEFDGDSVEKTYRKRTECEFDGFVVGYTRIDVKGRIGTNWDDPECGSEYGFCFKMITERPKVAVVYFKNNMKRYVLPEDMEEVS